MFTFCAVHPKESISAHTDERINVHIYTGSFVTAWRTGAGCPGDWNEIKQILIAYSKVK